MAECTIPSSLPIPCQSCPVVPRRCPGENDCERLATGLHVAELEAEVERLRTVAEAAETQAGNECNHGDAVNQRPLERDVAGWEAMLDNLLFGDSESAAGGGE